MTIPDVDIHINGADPALVQKIGMSAMNEKIVGVFMPTDHEEILKLKAGVETYWREVYCADETTIPGASISLLRFKRSKPKWTRHA